MVVIRKILIIYYCGKLKDMANITNVTETYFQLRSRSVK